MLRQPALKLVAVSLLALLLLSLPTFTPAAGGSAAQTPLGQVLPRAAANPPAPRHPGAPALRLAWATPETHVGVPVALTVQATTAGGQPDAARSGTVLLQADDTAVAIGASGAASADAGVPRGRGQQVSLPLSGGQAHATLTFARPGRQTVFAQLQDAPQVAGESTALVVHPTLLTLQAQPTAVAGAPALVTVVAQDDQHRPLAGYAGSVLVRSDDPQALVEATTAGSGSAAPPPGPVAA